MNLFEINQQLMNCIKLASGDYVDTETGEVIDTEAIEALEMEKNEKIRNIACWIRNLDADEKALAEQEKIFKDRKTAVKNKKDSLKAYLASFLNGEKWKNNEVAISWRESEAVELAENLDITKLPKQYVDYDPKINKALLKKDIKAGIEIDGVQLVKRNNIQIK
jgi:hypothetical protein